MVVALVAVTPHLMALADVQGWVGAVRGFASGRFYLWSFPVTLGLAVWALSRASRAPQVAEGASPRERRLAVAATALSIPVLLLVLVAFLGVVAYGISGGG